MPADCVPFTLNKVALIHALNLLILLIKECKTEKPKTKPLKSPPATGHFFKLFETNELIMSLPNRFISLEFLSSQTFSSPITSFIGTGSATSLLPDYVCPSKLNLCFYCLPNDGLLN